MNGTISQRRQEFFRPDGLVLSAQVEDLGNLPVLIHGPEMAVRMRPGPDRGGIERPFQGRFGLGHFSQAFGLG